jgi:hypothetical protein
LWKEETKLKLLLDVPVRSTLYSLARAIPISYKFDFYHAFGFYDHIKKWTDLIEEYE